ncbi:MAG: FixH family protein [Saprospiraceae bacterium]|nr:FixH family protein [Saprospiraceae bacterium]
MSWGYKILAMYGAFILLIGALVFGSYQQDVNLVSKDYYQREIEFQQVIDGRNNLQKISAQPEILLLKDILEVKLPAGSAELKNLEIWIYNASNPAADIKYNEASTVKRTFSFPLTQVHKGQYHLKIKWMENGLPYYFDKEMSI